MTRGTRVLLVSLVSIAFIIGLFVGGAITEKEVNVIQTPTKSNDVPIETTIKVFEA